MTTSMASPPTTTCCQTVISHWEAEDMHPYLCMYTFKTALFISAKMKALLKQVSSTPDEAA